jgi:hypothetical protein
MREVVAVLLTGALHLVFEEVLDQKLLFIALAGIGWLLYLGIRVRREPGLIAGWGFQRQGLAAAFRHTSIFGGIAIGAMAVFGAIQGTLGLHWHMLPLLALYPVWGLVQQFLLQGLLTRNLVEAVPALRSPWRVTPVAAVLFGLVHLPDLWLAGATFLLALAFTPFYLRDRNLWPLGLWHGWLGVFAYFWILGRDPWVATFG